jgi:hypothetical protein
MRAGEAVKIAIRPCPPWAVRAALSVAFLGGIAAGGGVASAQETVRIDIDPNKVWVGHRGVVRFERFNPLKVKLDASGPGEARLAVEVVGTDLDGDRVLYRRETFVDEVKGRPLEMLFVPPHPGNRETGTFTLTLVVRDLLTREALARRPLDFRLEWDPPGIAAAGPGRMVVASAEKRLVVFVAPTPGTGDRPLAGSGGFEAFLRTYRIPGPQVSNSGSGGDLDLAASRFAWCEEQAADLPSTPAGYDPVDVLVWAPSGRENLSPAQQRAMVEWVASGGRLVVFLGKRWQEVRGKFPAAPAPVPPQSNAPPGPAPKGLLPVEMLDRPPAGVTAEMVEAALTDFTRPENALTPSGFRAKPSDRPAEGPPAPGSAPAPAATAGGVSPLIWVPAGWREAGATTGFADVRTLIEAAPPGKPEAGVPLAVEGRLGAGSVTVCLVSPADDPLSATTVTVSSGMFDGWPGTPFLWRKLLAAAGPLHPVREIHGRQWQESRDPRGADEVLDADEAFDRTLEDFRLPAFGTGLVLLLLVVYALLVGPGSWFALRSYGLLRWTWPVFAALVIAAGVLSFTGVGLLRGIALRRNRLTVLDLPAGGGPAAGWHFDCLYCPYDGEFGVAPPASGWTMPWLWHKDAADGTLVGESYSQNVAPEDGRAVGDLSGVPIRNHVKKFVTRFARGASQGRLDAELTARVAVWEDRFDPDRSESAFPINRPPENAGAGAPGGPAPRPPMRQSHYRVTQVDWRITNRLDYDLIDVAIIVWPNRPGVGAAATGTTGAPGAAGATGGTGGPAAGAAPADIVGDTATVIDHRGNACRRITATYPDANGKPVNFMMGLDETSTAGAAVLRIPRLPKGQTLTGSTDLATSDPKSPTYQKPGQGVSLTGLGDWLAEFAARPGLDLDNPQTTVAALSIQSRLRFDPVRRYMRDFPDPATAVGVGPTGRFGRPPGRGGGMGGMGGMPPVIPGTDIRTQCVRTAALGFLDLSGRTRPNEAILIGAPDAETPPAPETATVKSAGGSPIQPYERAGVVVRMRVPLGIAAGPSSTSAPPTTPTTPGAGTGASPSPKR